MAVLAQPGRVHLRRSRLGAAPLLPAVASVALLLLVLGSESNSQPPSPVWPAPGVRGMEGRGSGLGSGAVGLCPALASPPCAYSVLLMWPRESPAPGVWRLLGCVKRGASHLVPSLTVLLNSDLK